MDVSKNKETPQDGWFIMETPLLKMGWFGGSFPPIFGNTQMVGDEKSGIHHLPQGAKS